MTIGEKIKYLRKRRDLTQDQLGRMTGIHPVTIRKYEINKIQPSPAQIERLAAALGVGCVALSGIEKTGLRIQTVGDLLGLIMALCDVGVLYFSGDRGLDNLLIRETASIQVNPIFDSYLKFTIQETDIDIINLQGHPKVSTHFQQMLIWEKANFMYQRTLATAGEEPDIATKAVLKSIEDTKCKIELDLQRSQILLNLN